MSLSINGIHCTSLHFIGILGSGMSAVAQYCCFDGLRVSGSDRLNNSAETLDIQSKLEGIGCAIVPQDGSGIISGLSVAIVSTAIEESNPDICAARNLNIPIVHRSDVLAAIVATKKTIAVAGTSGKSTVAAMIFEFLAACGKKPSLITGAGLLRLEESGCIGNAVYGSSNLLVIEADESDGTLVKYKPAISLFLNVSKDHKPVDEIVSLFNCLALQSHMVITNADDAGLSLMPSTHTFGLTESAFFHPDSIDALSPKVVLNKNGQEYSLPLPGRHNASNLIAALCVCTLLGCDTIGLARAVSAYRGVKRRFAVTMLKNNITVIDDFAHNPDKVTAAISTAQTMCTKLFAIFQPHGYGPTRFLKNEFIDAFSRVLRPDDELFLLPIYYAGGTAVADISSDDLAGGIIYNNRIVHTPPDRTSCISVLQYHIKPGNAVLIMGARDPSLSFFVQDVISALSGK